MADQSTVTDHLHYCPYQKNWPQFSSKQWHDVASIGGKLNLAIDQAHQVWLIMSSQICTKNPTYFFIFTAVARTCIKPYKSQ